MSVDLISDEVLKYLELTCVAVVVGAAVAYSYLRYRQQSRLSKAVDARALKRIELQTKK